ncbi:MAG TPA: hypothetical protein VFE37_03255 [Chloroflexota bacterium]|nr:hypothetical protein [Chloroflexota bacterium]
MPGAAATTGAAGNGVGIGVGNSGCGWGTSAGWNGIGVGTNGVGAATARSTTGVAAANGALGTLAVPFALLDGSAAAEPRHEPPERVGAWRERRQQRARQRRVPAGRPRDPRPMVRAAPWAPPA